MCVGSGEVLTMLGVSKHIGTHWYVGLVPKYRCLRNLKKIENRDSNLTMFLLIRLDVGYIKQMLFHVQSFPGYACETRTTSQQGSYEVLTSNYIQWINGLV